ncbi:MAG: L-rhamnose isomerase [Terracidiphilus sp.]|nr:L-rhamnose isomerase [Terracidiphilus sp.]MDR3777319.1 L-rhamnose isomerase [Terracidiphilus sp.]
MKDAKQKIQAAYELAKERFAEIGVDTEKALQTLNEIPISIQCWQGDDVRGFENPEGDLTGGIQTTGNYPGRARTADELRADLDVAFAQIPGSKRLNLHAIYLESATPVKRDAIEPKHFEGWVKWAKANDLGLDFNPTCFSHPLSERATLSHPDAAVRKFWIDHCLASRTISEYFGTELGTPAVMNIWIPDGDKDSPADRMAPRKRLMAALDEIIAAPLGKHHKVAVEGKLFGIGTEAYTVGSNDFYLAYAATRKTLLCLDAGHFHPTENVSDKISTALCYLDEILLHVSRPVRWDSDHVVLLDEATIAIAQEIVRTGSIDRVNIGLDFFDASINRLAAWIIGARNMRKALLLALLEPAAKQLEAEANFDGATRLALFEEQKSMPWSAVWEYYCASQNVATGIEWLDTVRSYEKETLSTRGNG